MTLRNAILERLPHWSYPALRKARSMTFAMGARVSRYLPANSHTPPRRSIETLEQYAAECPDKAQYKQVYDKTTIQRSEPVHTGDLHPCFARDMLFDVVKVGVGTIKGGKVLTRMGAIITPDYRLVCDVSDTGQALTHPLLSKLHMPEQLKKTTVAAVITTYTGGPGRKNYTHWTTDILPRLALLEKTGAKYDWLIAPQDAGFEREMLRLLGITNIISDPDIIVEADELLAPSMTSKPMGRYAPWPCQWLREKFLPMAPRPSGERPKRLYISRERARVRHVLNEQLLIEAIKPFGFVPICFEDMSFLEGAALMRDAEAVISPHGSGNVNFVFCSPATPVIEIFDPGYVAVTNWHIADNVGLRYGYSLGEGKSLDNHMYTRKDITARIDDVLEVMGMTGMR
jgi:capsular polysaccharide biosynthesis protein